MKIDKTKPLGRVMVLFNILDSHRKWIDSDETNARIVYELVTNKKLPGSSIDEQSEIVLEAAYEFLTKVNYNNIHPWMARDDYPQLYITAKRIIMKFYPQ